MMKVKGQDELITQYKMAPFTIQVLSKLRTFCEKIMSLVRFSRSEEPIMDLRNKIRHVYDIHQMLKDKDIEQFFKSHNFDDMLIKVGNNDRLDIRIITIGSLNIPQRQSYLTNHREHGSNLVQNTLIIFKIQSQVNSLLKRISLKL